MASLLGDASNGFGSLNIIKQVGLVFGITISFILAFFIVNWANTPSYAPAYTQLDSRDLAPMADALEKYDIASKVDYASNSLLVPANQVIEDTTDNWIGCWGL